MLTVSVACPHLGPGGPGVAGRVGYVPITSEGHWVVVGCGLVDQDGLLGKYEVLSGGGAEL